MTAPKKETSSAIERVATLMASTLDLLVPSSSPSRLTRKDTYQEGQR